MKIKEAIHIGRLPAAQRRLVARYSVKKTLGLQYSREEKEANLALRVASASDAFIERVDEHGMHWGLTQFGVPIKLETRRYPSSDLGIMFQIFCKQEYLPAVELLRKQNPGRAPRIFDAGANVGFSALYFKAAFPDCELQCLEIDDDNFAQLKKNLSPWKGVILAEHALWKKDAFLTIGRDFRDQSECSYYTMESETPTPLRGFSLRHFMNTAGWDHIDLLKIDIEGSERYLFETPELARDVLSTTNILALEIHDEFNIRATILGFLEQEGFQYFDHGDLTIAHRPV
jgi:FkbM family methyltransferase